MSSAGSSSVSTQRTDGEERTCKDRRFPEPGVTAVLWNQLFPVISCPGRKAPPGGTRPRPLPTLGTGSRRLLRGLGSRAQPGSVCGSERAGSGPGTAVGALLSRPRGLVSARAVPELCCCSRVSPAHLAVPGEGVPALPSAHPASQGSHCSHFPSSNTSWFHLPWDRSAPPWKGSVSLPRLVTGCGTWQRWLPQPGFAAPAESTVGRRFCSGRLGGMRNQRQL